MKVVIVEPLLHPYEKDIDTSLEAMQHIVGGTIQAIYPFEDQEVALICNDEAKLLRMTPNRLLLDKDRKPYDVICGTFFICAAPFDSESFESLNNEQISWYKKQFETPEIYLPW